MATMELRRPTSSAVDDLDYNHFKRRVRERTGIDLASYKPDQMRRRLRTLMQRSHARTFTEYFRLLDRDPEKLREFQAFFTINVSELFRNPEKFDVLRRVVLPDLLNRHARLRVWSAGCSYGAEAYSIAILLKELAPRSRHYILATDVDESVLTRAQAADSYSEQDL
ncbi:MAG: chemotaxis protein CheR, partial [Chloroflexota bacterium]|nr:chemotaxis protein CheR [Chloroflexota bacterium]